MLTSQKFSVNPCHWSISDFKITCCYRPAKKQHYTIYWSYFCWRQQSSALYTSRFSSVRMVQQLAGTLADDNVSYLSATLGFPIPWQKKHLSLLPGTLLPDVPVTQSKCIWPNPYASIPLRSRAAQDLQWKGEWLFCFRYWRYQAGSGHPLWLGFGRQVLLQLWKRCSYSANYTILPIQCLQGKKQW